MVDGSDMLNAELYKTPTCAVGVGPVTCTGRYNADAPVAKRNRIDPIALVAHRPPISTVANEFFGRMNRTSLSDYNRPCSTPCREWAALSYPKWLQ